MKYENLVISGGGLKGYYFIGAIKYLIENKLLNIKKILGVSIGSIIGYLLIIGYEINEIIAILLKITLDRYTPELVLDKLYYEYYCLDNSKIIKMIEFLSWKKNINPNITMVDLYDLTKIELIVGTCNLTKQIYEYISYKTYPNLPVIIGLQMSFALPLIFKPVNYKNNLYIDGGFYNNYPINYFKKEIKKTIGITINYNNNVNDIFEFITSMINFVSEKKNIKHKYNLNSIFIKPCEEFNILDFENIKNIRVDMINSGYLFAKKYCEKIDFIEKIILDIINKI
jgi:predicted acylesterase/phospholipase RssA